MRILFISDIHGIKTNLPKVEEAFSKLNCDKLVVLGDILNNGFHTYDYSKEYVKAFLNLYKNNLIIVKGNCDYSNDFSFLGINPNYVEKIKTDKTEIYITHGHLYNDRNWERKNTILIQGHTHVPKIEELDSNLFINPGSISKPRGMHAASYLFFDENRFIIYDVEGRIILEKVLKNDQNSIQ